VGSTPNWAIYYLENGDPQSQITESGVQAGTIENALDQVGGNVESVNNFGVQYFVNASARDLALTAPAVGWLSQIGSELFMRRWNGSAWIPFGAGLYPLFPSSVGGTGVVVADDGCVDFTSATTVNINGVFSSEFRDYQIELEVTAGSTDLGASFRLRASGTDSSANYSTHYTYGFGSTTASGATAETDRTFTQIGTGRQISSRMTLRSPAVARATLMRTEFARFNNAGEGSEGLVAARHTATTAYDGFTLFPTSGDMTGHVRVFGIG
jgi:hypothetical protein